MSVQTKNAAHNSGLVSGGGCVLRLTVFRILEVRFFGEAAVLSFPPEHQAAKRYVQA